MWCQRDETEGETNGRHERDHHPDIRLDGDLLHIDADSGNVTYRIGDKHPTQDAFYAEWPD